MSVSEADIAFALELFSQLPDISSRKMMGGLAIYSGGQIFAIVGDSGQIYLKAKGALADRLASEGSTIFSTPRGTMGYWTLPDAALDDPDLACDWARRALTA